MLPTPRHGWLFPPSPAQPCTAHCVLLLGLASGQRHHLKPPAPCTSFTTMLLQRSLTFQQQTTPEYNKTRSQSTTDLQSVRPLLPDYLLPGTLALHPCLAPWHSRQPGCRDSTSCP